MKKSGKSFRFGNIIKRFVVFLLAATILTCSTSVCYMDAYSARVYASVPAALKALVEAVMASMGLSFSNTSDLESASAALGEQMANSSSSNPTLKALYDSIIKLALGPSGCAISLSAGDYAYIRNFLYNLCADKISSASDVTTPALDINSFEKVEVFKGTISYTDAIWGLSVDESKFYTGENGEYRFFDMSECLMMTSILSDDGVDMFYILNPESETAETGYFVAEQRSFYCSDIGWDSRYDNVALGEYAYTYYRSDSYNPTVWHLSFDYSNDKSYLVLDDYYKAGNRFSDGVQGYYIQGEELRLRYMGYSSPDGGVNIQFLPYMCVDDDYVYPTRVFINSGTKVYASSDDYSKAQDVPASSKPSSTVYGASSAATNYQVDESGNVSVNLTEESITQAVADAVEAALAANPSISQAALNAAVAQVISSNSDVKDDIEASTGTLSKLINEVKAIVSGNANLLDVMQVNLLSIADSITKLSKTATANSNALSDLKSKVSVWDDWAGSDTTAANDDTESAAKVWVPPAMSVPKIFKQALDFIANPLSNITKFLKEIKDEIISLPAAMAGAIAFPKAQDIADAMVTVFPKVSDITKAVSDGLSGFPKAKDFADAMATVFPKADDIVEVMQRGLVFPKAQDIADALVTVFPKAQEIADAFSKGLTFPKAQDITDSLAEVFPTAASIPKILSDFFVIDTDYLGEKTKALGDVWTQAIPFAGEVSSIFDKFKFSDNYVYPVIKIQTPQILRAYYQEDHIILVDFADYKTQCEWARGLVKCMLWFSFGLSIFSHIKTSLHIG